jgi:hypothetical protein
MKKIDAEFQTFASSFIADWNGVDPAIQQALRFAFYGGAIIGAKMSSADMEALFVDWTVELLARARNAVPQKGAQA